MDKPDFICRDVYSGNELTVQQFEDESGINIGIYDRNGGWDALSCTISDSEIDKLIETLRRLKKK